MLALLLITSQPINVEAIAPPPLDAALFWSRQWVNLQPEPPPPVVLPLCPQDEIMELMALPPQSPPPLGAEQEVMAQLDTTELVVEPKTPPPLDGLKPLVKVNPTSVAPSAK